MLLGALMAIILLHYKTMYTLSQQFSDFFVIYFVLELFCRLTYTKKEQLPIALFQLPLFLMSLSLHQMLVHDVILT